MENMFGRQRCLAAARVTGRLVLVALCVIGAVSVGKAAVGRCKRWKAARVATERIPNSKLPGPPRTWEAPQFVLNDDNANTMIGVNDPAHERWADIAGNYYASEFVRRFSYKNTAPDGAIVRVQVDPLAPTLRGRLEARRLKPNFAYQLKLRGIFEHRWSFEAIGFAGRWRLPGKGTNYTDDDYRQHQEKEKVEAYFLFDYFITDARGSAARDFALDSCLHVLWSATRQHVPSNINDVWPTIVDARNPLTYARPKAAPSVEFFWAERERGRYQTAGQTQFLPAGDYNAEIVLTEESLHSNESDGGWWATVYRCPVEFTVMPPVTNEVAATSE